MAVTKNKIFNVCPACNGAKEVPDPEWNQTPANPTERPMITCPKCLGEGVIEDGYVQVPSS